MKDFKNFVTELNKAMKILPNKAFYHIYRGLSNENLELKQSMQKDYDTALKINPSKAMFHFNKGKALFDAKEYEKALLELNKAIDIEQKFIYYNFRTRINRQLNNIEETENDEYTAKKLQIEEKLH